MNKDKWKRYFTMKAKAEKSAEVLIYEDIGESFFSEGIGAKQFAKELKALGDITQLDVRINSPGGSVFEGQAIYSQLKNHKASKTVYIDGLAASIASVIAMAGDTIVMPKNATMMIHDPWSMAVGTADDMRKMAEALDTVKSGILAAYRDKSGLDDGTISELMSEETWMDADEAAEWGFVDQVEEPVQIAAHFDLARFKNAPAELKALAIKAAAPTPAAAAPVKNKEVKTMKCKKHPSTDMIADGECPKCNEEVTLQNAVKETRTQEMERITSLTNMGREYKQDKLAEYAVQEGWSEDQLREKILDRIKEASVGGGPLNITVTPAHEGKPFRSLGEQLVAVANTARGHPDARLREVYDAATGAGESVPSDGGFLVQTDFTTELLTQANETMVLAPRCRHIPLTGNSLEAPIVDETSRATGSRWGGVQIYRSAEAGTVTKSKPKLGKLEMKLEKIMGIFYASDELLADASALESIASQAFTEEFGFVVDDEIIRGSGAGRMLGILNAACLVTQAKETGQLAATIQAENIINMYSRMPARSKPNAVWLINSECMPQIMQLSLILGTSAVPLYMPPGGLSQLPYGTIFGKPVIEIEQASALGTVGDILFVDLSQYAIIEKGGLNAAQSMHVQFLTDEMTYRWTARNNGQPIWKSALTPYKGSATRSPFVALITRA